MVISKILLLCAIITSSVIPQKSSEFQLLPLFRGYDWGETIENVKAKELSKYLQTMIGFGEEIISYNGSVAGLDARVDYVFRNGILVEGLYQITVKSFEQEYQTIKEHYIKKLDYPIYWANAHPNTKINWDDENPDLVCRGPEIYWEYYDGFVAIITEKYKEEITISILYAHEKTIRDYGKYVIYPYEVISEN